MARIYGTNLTWGEKIMYSGPIIILTVHTTSTKEVNGGKKQNKRKKKRGMGEGKRMDALLHTVDLTYV